MDTRLRLSILLADSDRRHRAVVRTMLADLPCVGKLTEADCVADASQALLAGTYDCALVADDLAGGGGFALLRQPGLRKPDYIIFLASGPENAIEAFAFHPVDYLTRPADPVRLRGAVECVLGDRTRLLSRSELESALQREDPVEAIARRILIKTGGKLCFLRPDEIDWVEAERDYVRIHQAGKKHLIRDRISSLEKSLPGSLFLRIHRSTIVNIERIKEMQSLPYGEYAVILNDGTRLTLSRSFRERVFSRLVSAA